MNKKTSKLLAVLMAVAMIFSMMPLEAQAWSLSKKPEADYETVTKVRSSDTNEDEWYEVSTPSDKPYYVYVKGKTKIENTELLAILPTKTGTKSTIRPFRILVTPNDAGEFHVRVKCKKDSAEPAEALTFDGEVPTDENPACCEIMGPVYKGVETYAPQPRKHPTNSTYDKKIFQDIDESDYFGFYRLNIGRLKKNNNVDWASQKSTEPGHWSNSTMVQGGYAWRDALLRINKYAKPQVITYPEVISENNRTIKYYESDGYKKYQSSVYKSSVERYKDKYLRDFSPTFFFRDFDNPNASTTTGLNKSRVDYIKKVSDQVTAGATTDREKALKIYEYLAKNFYYDNVATRTGNGQAIDPYTNLYKLRNGKGVDGKTVTHNSEGHKVTTVCDGFAAMFAALARAQDIPTRCVRGRHLADTADAWGNLPLNGDDRTAINSISHYWNELWIDGKWMMVDATKGCNSSADRLDGSFSKGDRIDWKHIDFINYAGFDPTPEAKANSYYRINIMPGPDNGRYVSRKNEYNQLNKFLEAKSNGVRNGTRLNRKYKRGYRSTWGEYEFRGRNFRTNGSGRMRQIMWGNKGLTGGYFNVNDFTALEILMIHQNKLTQLQAKNCSKLERVNANSNNIRTANLSNSKRIRELKLNYNKLTYARFYGRKKGGNITVKRNSNVGRFEMEYKYNGSKYNELLKIKARPAPRGYYCAGIYAGKRRLTRKSQLTIKNPKASTYYVKFYKK